MFLSPINKIFMANYLRSSGICLLTLVIQLHTPATAATSRIGVTSTPPWTDWLEEQLSI